MKPSGTFDYGPLTRRLHAAGWASHVTVERLLTGWTRLADEVGDYGATIDDYTNDVTKRDALALVLKWASPAVRRHLGPQIVAADEAFREATVPDVHEVIRRYYRFPLDAEWWWRRRPTTGRLGEYLDEMEPDDGAPSHVSSAIEVLLRSIDSQRRRGK